MSATVNQVAIIGAGQLGRRHLQGLVKSSQQLSIHVVDPFEGSRHAVEGFVASMEPSTLPSIQVHSSVETLPVDLDLVIIATTANQRLEAIEKLTSKCNVRYLVLEKFLFNDSEDYARASSLITKYGIGAWVNTPRRFFNIYRQLREQTCDDRLLHFCADGGDWGLCCNSVHFVDLAQFLCGATELREMRSRFDVGVLSSKRDGYVELTGEVSGEVGSASFTLRSIRGSIKPITLTLHYEHQTLLVAEGAGKLWRIGQSQLETNTFRLPYQSEMTGVIADQLFTSGTCDLAPYADSVAAHLPLLRLFAQQAGQVTDSWSKCSIT